jgi:hypothetical protein
MLNLILTIFTIVVICLLTVFLRTCFVLGDVKSAITYYKENSVWKDWRIFGGIISAIVTLLFILYSPKSDAAELTYFEYTQVYVGLDFQIQAEAPECLPGSIEDNITANGGIRQHLIGMNYGWWRVDFTGGYLHHSCAIGKDDKVYDAVMGTFIFTFYRR